jgi:PRTRC genetic system protein E
MTTNFFQNIANLNVPGNWKLTLHTDEAGNFTVSALFTALQQADNALKAIPPMLLRGTATELDEGFFEAINEPVQQTADLYHNLNAYHKGLEDARLKSKMELDKKAKENKAKPKTATGEGKEDDIEISEPKLNKEEKRRAYTQAMIGINELKAACKYGEALALLPAIVDYPEKEAELTKKAEELTRLKAQMDKSLQLL